MKTKSISVVKKLYFREVLGHLPLKASGVSRCKIYEQLQDKLKIPLRSIIQMNLLSEQVIIGFSRDGKYILSYQCRGMTNESDYISFEYKYSLHWWEFHFKKPAKEVHMVNLFAGESIQTRLQLLVCQPPSENYIVVHGSTLWRNQRSAISSPCYLTIAPSPVESLVSETTSHAVHLKYDLIPPHPQFWPSINLKLKNTVLLNSGDVICAVTCHIRNGSKKSYCKSCEPKTAPILCTPDCLCSPAVIGEVLENLLPRFGLDSCFDFDNDSCGVGKENGLSNIKQNCEYKDDNDMKKFDCINLNDGVKICQDSSDNDLASSIHNEESQNNGSLEATLKPCTSEPNSGTNPQRHTSSYLYYYSTEQRNNSGNSNSPFDFTSEALPVKATSSSGVEMEQVYSHKCFTKQADVDLQMQVKHDANLIVRQTVLDAEQFLDGQFQCMESLKDSFVSLRDYDMQIVEVCPASENVIILIIALVGLTGKSRPGQNYNQYSSQSCTTGFLFTWNIRTSEINVLKEYPLVKFQKPKCKPHSFCLALKPAVELRKPFLFPENANERMVSFSNHAVLSGQSFDYLLHPFLPLVLVK